MVGFISKAAIFATTGVSIIGFIFWWWQHSGSNKCRSKNLTTKLKKRPIPAGLINFGNTCFMNVILQCLAGQVTFADWLKKYCELYHMNNHVLLAETLNKIVRMLDGHSDYVCYDPSFVLSDLSARGWHISFDEHDAHEFFHCIMTTLDEEISCKKVDLSLSSCAELLRETQLAFSSRSSGDVGECQASRNVHSTHNHKISIKSMTRHSYHGTLSVRLRCCTCRHQNPVSYERFDSLSLPISLYRKSTLHECINSFLSCEVLNDVKCGNCTANRNGIKSSVNPNDNDETICSDTKSCSIPLTAFQFQPQFITSKRKGNSPESKPATSPFYKFLHFAKLPQCLCIHLQRLVWKHGMPQKLPHHVEFTEILDLGPFIFNYKTKCEPLAVSSPLFNMLLQKRADLARSNLHSLNTSRPGLCGGATSNLKKLRNNRQSMYQLTGLVVHLGNWSCNGHFVAYRRMLWHDHQGKKSPQWFYISDSFSKRISLKEVLSQPAYMLFYERL